MMEPHYERLSALDASFLAVEDENAHMHVGSLSTFDAKPMLRGDGALDFERIRRAIECVVYKCPRLHQKVWWPLGAPPVWIDDLDFQLSYHLRHTALPRPGTVRQLKRLAGRVMSQKLDLAKPLWELWIIEGLEQGRFAILAKLHHCLADGIAAREILTGYLDVVPRHDAPDASRWRARPSPSLARLHVDEMRRRAEGSAELLLAARDLLGRSSFRETIEEVAGNALDVLGSFVHPASHTPLNDPIGPHRRIDFTRCEFGAVQGIRKVIGGKVNDVVLACVTGAVRRYFLGRKCPVDDLDFRILVPVNTRTQSDGAAGNRVSTLLVPVSLAETDPRRRLEGIIEVTSRLKGTQQSQTTDLLARLADRVGLFLPQVLGSRFGASPLALGYNLIVTNVPGPMIPQYFLESLLFDSYPLVPITSNQALGIALYTYNGVLHWGFHADWDALPDLHDFVLDVDAELSALVDACRPIELRPARKSTEPTAPEATARASTRGRRPRKPRPPEIAPDAG
jgi:WS/DGAT/MGAT family acyltransferase